MENLLEKVEILYQDQDVLVINKPAGLITHSDGRTEESSLAEWVIKNYPALRDVGEPWLSPQGEVIPRPGIVHRLDRETSGVMIIAKTVESHAFLKSQFQNRQIEKFYRAFVYGHPKAEKGVIEAEIGRTKKAPRRWTAMYGKKGNLRAAITYWQVLKRGVDPQIDEKISFLELSPKTGRTHQIRVHLKSINHPVLCDKLYAPNLSKSEAISNKLQSRTEASEKQCLLGFERLALHAFQIKFKTSDGKLIDIEAPYPDDFKNALNNIKG